LEIELKKNGVIAEKIALGSKIFGNKKLADMVLLFICQTSYCPRRQ